MRVRLLTVTIVVAGLACLAPAAASVQQTVAPGQALPPLLPGAGSPPLPTTGTGAISGVVTDATSGRPIAGAVVSLSITGRGPVGRPPRMVTDARGRFVFRDLPAASDYVLNASRFGYANSGYGRTAPDAATVRLRLAENQWLADANVRLWRLGAISGRVVDEHNEPVVGIAMRAFALKLIAGQPYHVAGPVTTTDDRGVYRLTNLAPGSYVVGLLSVQSTVLASTPEGAPRLAIGALDSGGYMSSAARGAAVGAPLVSVTETHRLAVTNFGVPPAPEGGQARAYPPVFYPGTTSLTAADALDVAYGTSRANVDFQIRPVPAARVTGRVDGASGPVTNMLLRLMPAGSERLGFGSEAATTLVDRDGRFTFLNVPAGNYTVVAQPTLMDFRFDSSDRRLPEPPGFSSNAISVGSMPGVPGLSYLATTAQNGGAMWGRQPVATSGRDIDDLVLTLRSAVKIRGRVVFDGDTRRPNEREHLSMEVEPANGDPALGLHRDFTKDGDTTYSFTIDGLMAGQYLLERAAGAWRVMSVVWNSRDVTDTGFDAASGADFDDVIVTMTDKLITVAGTVTDAQGQPGSAAAVIAFPVNRSRWINYGWSPIHIGSQPATGAGTYRFQNLPEGEYYLVAVPSAQATAWRDPKFLEAAAPLATRVAVKWGEQKTQDLRVVEARVR
jgi:hypothetical protein